MKPNIFIFLVCSHQEMRHHVSLALWKEFPQLLTLKQFDFSLFKFVCTHHSNVCFIIPTTVLTLAIEHTIEQHGHSLILLQSDDDIKTKNRQHLVISHKDEKRQIIEKVYAQNYDLKTENDKSLSEREIEVVRLIAGGLTNKEIAEKLFISPHTVITHRKNITAKLGIKTISGLTVYAILQNIISTDDAILQ
jgi:DNA-binding CsgD family transcriptional regulator